MIRTLEERVDAMIEPRAQQARVNYYAHHGDDVEAKFWRNPVKELAAIIDHQLKTKSRDVVSIINADTDTLSAAVPDLNRIQITAEVLTEFRRILQNQHGQIVVPQSGFNPTVDFSHHYLQHLWKHHLANSNEWTLLDAVCEGTIWNGAKLTYEELNAYKLQHNDGCAVVFHLPKHEEALLQVYYFNVPVDRQVGLVGATRFKQLFNMLVKDTLHPAMVSPCLMTNEEATPIRGREWRFDGYGRSADDVTRLMAYWMRLGAVRPMFNGEPKDYLYFANPNNVLMFKELLTEEYGSNPYRLLAPNHCIYDAELAEELSK